jgi:hypothetical protein
MKKYIIQILYKIISILDFIDYHYIKNEKLIDNYKTIEEISLENIEILTDTGYKELSHLMIIELYKSVSFITRNPYNKKKRK